MIIIVVGDLAMLLMFGYVAIVRRILNSGTFAGIAASLLLLAIVWAWSSLNPVGQAIAIGVVVLGAIGVALPTIGIIKAGSKRSVGPGILIVLGCSLENGRPGQVLTSRLETARRYLENNPDTMAILSGGQMPRSSRSEAAAMAEYLKEKGIASLRLHLEANSRSTQENLEQSRLLLTKLQSNDEVIIVTSEFHQYRARMIAQSIGLTATALCAKTPTLLLPSYYLREVIAIWARWLLEKR